MLLLHQLEAQPQLPLELRDPGGWLSLSGRLPLWETGNTQITPPTHRSPNPRVLKTEILSLSHLVAELTGNDVKFCLPLSMGLHASEEISCFDDWRLHSSLGSVMSCPEWVKASLTFRKSGFPNASAPEFWKRHSLILPPLEGKSDAIRAWPWTSAS